MTLIDKMQGVIPAWAISLTLHGIGIGVAFALSAQLKPFVQEERFTWDVALVQRASPVADSESVESTATSVPSPVQKHLPSRTKPVTDTSHPVRSMERNTETAPPPIEPVAAVPQAREEPVEQRVVEAEASKTAPAVETTISDPVAGTASPASPASQPAQREATANVSTSSEAPSPESTVTTASAGHEVKVDDRWLAESLWRRVAELKRYPNQARMNGQEGKVILRATIRADGQLADVFVQKSSGYSALDEAAIEAVKLACPLHMKHAIGKSQIVVSLPIVYSLAN